ncbi:MAG: rod shape-determining protein RodA [Gammaproteobacteria bacterium]|nr:rod shape-determining protein RodA [Gammaproteobacteria bacterium]
MLLLGILVLGIISLGILYSVNNQNSTLFWHQIINFSFAFGVMFIFAQIPIYRYQSLVPWFFCLTLLMLLVVMSSGVISRGAQRWLNFGMVRFQPSELMKLAMPMMLAWYLRNKTFPLHIKELFYSGIIIILPALIIAKQPDLGTAILVSATGCFVLLLAGITWRIIISVSIFLVSVVPIVWRFMHSYQKMRLLTFLSPESDPFGSGYNIIQSKIAIGSGGWLGKGWLHGSQAYLQFLPERSTDFIFAVYAEEFGFIGSLLLFAIFIYIMGRSLYISANAQDTFSRLLAGSLTLTFFTSFFVNIGMVMGVLPVVGVPLPLVSYGGSSLITFMTGFGIIMSVQAHRKLIGS